MTALQVALILALMIQFINALFWEGMILSSVSQKLWNLTSWIRKPLFDCPICMSPWWGSLILWVFNLAGIVEVADPVAWLTILAITGGINVVIVRVTDFE